MYNNGNCLGIVMYKKGHFDASNLDKLTESDFIENYCKDSGKHDNKECEFLEWYVKHFWGKKP